MKLHADSIAFDLLLRAAAYGELPYHALRLMPGSYESVKDAFQRLCRAGLLGLVKAPRIKCFYLTASGYEAYCKALRRERLEPLSKPEAVYDPPKALRLSRVNETNLFFALSGCCAYDTAREIKRAMEQTAVRSTDNLRYSRFAGRFPTPHQTYIVYHFGGGNQRLNQNGERNAEAALTVYPLTARKMLVADRTSAIVDILAYSLWARRKNPTSLRHMQLNFCVTVRDNPVLLPIEPQTQVFVRALDRPDWPERLTALEARALSQNSRTVSLLDGGWNSLLEHSDALSDSKATLLAQKKKREAGSGTITKRKDGRWEGRYTSGVDPASGKLIHHSVYGKTQKEVSAKLRAVTSEIDSGDFIEPARFTVAEWMGTYLSEYTPNLKPYALQSYEAANRNHIVPALGKIKLQSLNTIQIQTFINLLSRPVENDGKGLSAKTVRNIFGVLRRALQLAVRIGLLRHNPADACILPKPVGKKSKRSRTISLTLFSAPVNRTNTRLFI
ncbi:MAG: N-terminal phage integrase SAM-like domain-containing protein [Eubacteriales bacterium]|nr:N-terminal phage integrase SAM-like domain-containing protein [Eubacteriales bacterium]